MREKFTETEIQSITKDWLDILPHFNKGVLVCSVTWVVVLLLLTHGL